MQATGRAARKKQHSPPDLISGRRNEKYSEQLFIGFSS